MRANIYQNKIINILKKDHLMSLSQIHSKIGEANFSTIFRNVEQLLEEGIIKKICIDKDNVLYEMTDKNKDHDHFVCNDCGEISSINIPRKSIPIALSSSIETILIKGSCSGCINK